VFDRLRKPNQAFGRRFMAVLRTTYVRYMRIKYRVKTSKASRYI